jgi:hypothetical protein
MIKDESQPGNSKLVCTRCKTVYKSCTEIPDDCYMERCKPKHKTNELKYPEHFEKHWKEFASHGKSDKQLMEIFSALKPHFFTFYCRGQERILDEHEKLLNGLDFNLKEKCPTCKTPLINNGIATWCPKCEPSIVDSSSAGFKKCPICNNHSLEEDGSWCHNGCYRRTED